MLQDMRRSRSEDHSRFGSEDSMPHARKRRIVASLLVIGSFQMAGWAQRAPVASNPAGTRPNFQGFARPGAGPSGLTVTAVTPNSVVLAWKSVGPGATYQVFRNNKPLLAQPTAATTFTDTAVQLGTKYSYFVVANQTASGTLPGASSVLRIMVPTVLVERPVRLGTLVQPGTIAGVQAPNAKSATTPSTSRGRVLPPYPGALDNPVLRRRGAPPAQLTAQVSGANAIVLKWQPQPGAVYQIVRNGKRLLSKPITQAIFTDTDVRPHSAYTYMVIALYPGLKTLPSTSAITHADTP